MNTIWIAVPGKTIDIKALAMCSCIWSHLIGCWSIFFDSNLSSAQMPPLLPPAKLPADKLFPHSRLPPLARSGANSAWAFFSGPRNIQESDCSKLGAKSYTLTWEHMLAMAGKAMVDSQQPYLTHRFRRHNGDCYDISMGIWEKLLFLTLHLWPSPLHRSRLRVEVPVNRG